MHQIIYNLPPSVEQAFVYLLIGKACHCIDVRVGLSLSLSLSQISIAHIYHLRKLHSYTNVPESMKLLSDNLYFIADCFYTRHWNMLQSMPHFVFTCMLTIHCFIQIFERARQLLLVADRNVYEISYILSKYVRWYILLADLLQFYTTKSFGMNNTMQDLIKKTKTCITSVRLDQGNSLFLFNSDYPCFDESLWIHSAY